MTPGPSDQHGYDLYGLELDVRTELGEVAADEPGLAAGMIIPEPVNGPRHLGYEEIKFEETERYQASLQSLLGAIVSVEMDWEAMKAAGMMEPNEMPYGQIGSVGAVGINDETGVDV